MLKRNIKTDSVKANPKPNNFIRYLFGKLMPGLFGMPFHMKATLWDKDGNVKLVRHIYNTVTTSGKNGTADQILLSPTLAKPTHMALGTGTPAANALGAEVDRNAFTTKTRSTNVVTAVGDWAAGDATAAITEAGWFDQASLGGQMWLSASFAVINKGSLDTLQISWSFTIA